MNLLIKLIVNSMAVYISAAVLPGVHIDDFTSALTTAIVLAAANMLIKPVIVLFTLPINILTLGLFTLIINAFMVSITDSLIQGFWVQSFIWALLFTITLSIITSAINLMAKE